MRIIALEENRMWEFDEDAWQEFVKSVLSTFTEPARPPYPPELMLRSGTPTTKIVAEMANNLDARFVIFPSQWQRCHWEMEIS
jgi:hypothetical protein